MGVVVVAGGGGVLNAVKKIPKKKNSAPSRVWVRHMPGPCACAGPSLRRLIAILALQLGTFGYSIQVQ